MSLVPLADTRRKRKLSSGLASLASTETSKSFLNNMPTPRLQKNLYAQYGLVRKILAQSLEAETKFLLHNLMSDSKIMSVFSFVIPYIFLVFFFFRSDGHVKGITVNTRNRNFRKGCGINVVVYHSR